MNTTPKRNESVPVTTVIPVTTSAGLDVVTLAGEQLQLCLSIHKPSETRVIPQGCEQASCWDALDKSPPKCRAAAEAPPIGVFWDIENCQVPRGRSALAIVQKIRQKFFAGHREAEFVCVCDISKERKDVIEELNHAQITVIHVNAVCKNAADDKLRQGLRRFAHTYSAPATVVLVSGDVNFASELADLRNRHRLAVVCVHGARAAPALLAHAHETHAYERLVADLPDVGSPRRAGRGEPSNEIVVAGLPADRPEERVRARLRQLASNCGGKVVSVERGGGAATMRFASADQAVRACKRMEGEDVYGSTISVRDAATRHPSVTRDDVKRSPRKPARAGSDSRSPMKREREQPQQQPPAATPTQSPKRSQPTRDKSAPKRTQNCSPAGRDASGGRRQSPKCSPPIRDSASYQHTARGRSPKRFSPVRLSNGRRSSPSATNNRASSGGRAAGDDARHACRPHACSQDTRASYGPYPQAGYGAQQQQRRYHDSWNEFGCGDRARRHDDDPSPGNRHSWSSLSPVAFLDGDFAERARFAPIGGEAAPPYASPPPGGAASPRHCGYGYVQGYGMVPNPAALFADAVELRVSNLDQNIPARDLRKVLFAIFRQFVRVLHISLLLQADRSLVAMVKVPTREDAQVAIANLHRHKIGHKRIHVCVPTEKAVSAATLRTEVARLLGGVAGHAMPLFKFVEVFERRCRHPVSVSELYRMHDTVAIDDGPGGAGRTVRLVATSSPPPELADAADDDPPVCPRHCVAGGGATPLAWAEEDEGPELPLVRLPLRTFSVCVHMLLQLHDGGMPLASFPVCFAAEFEPLENRPDGGVPLERLLVAVPGVEIGFSTSGVKQVQWAANKGTPPEQQRGGGSPIITAQLLQFGREVIDLLKNSAGCRMPFSKFIPAYHHHFGRQCRVADYGYTRLMDLFDALTHVVTVIGEGTRKQVTLTPRAQLKRFTSDVLRCLKSQASKQVRVRDLPDVYAKVTGRAFDIADYGVCELMDLLGELADKTVVMTTDGEEDAVIAIPKREQTPEEIERTGQFAHEVLDLLRHGPSCRMPFNRFIPAYHHHFGRQCRVADYGFTKLIELFEAVVHVVTVIEKDDERYICLIEKGMLRVLADQATSLLQSTRHGSIPLESFMSAFMRLHGHSIRLQDYSVATLRQLLDKLAHVVTVTDSAGSATVALADRSRVDASVACALATLMDAPAGSACVDALREAHERAFASPLPDAVLRVEMAEMVQVSADGAEVTLAPLHMFARSLRALLLRHGGRLPAAQCDAAYLRHFGVALNPAEYGYPSLAAILPAVSHVVTARGRASKRTLHLRPPYAGGDDGRHLADVERELLRFSPVDLLAGAPPSNLPSPELCPELAAAAEALREQPNLIRLNTPSPIVERVLYASDLERAALHTPPMTPTSEPAAVLKGAPPAGFTSLQGPPALASLQGALGAALASLQGAPVDALAALQGAPVAALTSLQGAPADALAAAAISSACISPRSPARSDAGTPSSPCAYGSPRAASSPGATTSPGAASSPGASSSPLKLSPQRRMRIAAKFERLEV